MHLLHHEIQQLDASTASLLASVLPRCLQVGEVGPDWFNIYLIPETLRVTILGEKQENDVANIEIEAQTQVLPCPFRANSLPCVARLCNVADSAMLICCAGDC